MYVCVVLLIISIDIRILTIIIIIYSYIITDRLMTSMFMLYTFGTSYLLKTYHVQGLHFRSQTIFTVERLVDWI